MKKILKYLSIIIVVIVISATVYVKTSTNQTVEMQNKEALAEKPISFYVPCLQHIIPDCPVELVMGDGGVISFQVPGYRSMN